MRPKKIIFVFDDDEARRLQLCYTLELRLHCRAFSASGYGGRETIWDSAEPGAERADVAIVRLSQADTLCRRLQRNLPGIRVLVLCDESRAAGTAAAWVSTKASIEELLERVRILLAAKRGPKKPVVSVLAPEECTEGRTA